MLINIGKSAGQSVAGGGSQKPLSIALVAMPFVSIRRPSLQCGLLKSILVNAGHSVTVKYVNLRFAELVGLSRYSSMSEDRLETSLGEWLFSSAAFGKRTDQAEYFETCKIAEKHSDLGLSLHELTALRDEKIPQFLSDLCQDPSLNCCDLVGFTCTFDQQVPSFALARMLKERYPRLKTVFGGATFDLESSKEFVKKFSWIDYIIVGEADTSVLALARSVAAGNVPEQVHGLVHRVESTVRAVAPEVTHDLNLLPDPDYTEYFEQLTESQAAAMVHQVEIPFQAARGCWWGAKHHCTFCSLKDEEMAFRSRKPETVIAEVVRQYLRYGISRFTSADAILDLRYIDTLFRSIQDRGVDASFFYEIKANLNREQLRKLSVGGVKHVQPGIESLSSHLLQVMDKGTSKLLNLRLLKWAAFYQMRVSWNMLGGFPGESVTDFLDQARLLPRLYHLQPPSGAELIFLEKHGPYFVSNHEWFEHRRPSLPYHYLFPENVDIERVAQYYDYIPKWKDDVSLAFAELKEAVGQWRDRWATTPKPLLLLALQPDGSSTIYDTRTAARMIKYPLPKLETKILALCSDSFVGVKKIYQQCLASNAIIGDFEIQAALRNLEALALIERDQEQYLTLALPLDHQSPPSTVATETARDGVSGDEALYAQPSASGRVANLT